MIKRVAIGFGALVLSLVLALVVYYKVEPVGYYYRWGSGVSDMPDDFECDKPFDLGGCDVYFCRSKSVKFQWAKIMFYKGEMIDVLLMYDDEAAFLSDNERRRPLFCYLKYNDMKAGGVGDEIYIKKSYYECLGEGFIEDYMPQRDGRVFFDPRSKKSSYESYYEQCYDTSLKPPPNDPAPP